mmetsp:Transcript_23680/g.68036  ORF Transcript_23680/g.68036 Transcript_23680/m.68036 type:complete len:209 (+) Transcript_23680:212-838(+)
MPAPRRTCAANTSNSSSLRVPSSSWSAAWKYFCMKLDTPPPPFTAASSATLITPSESLSKSCSIASDINRTLKPSRKKIAICSSRRLSNASPSTSALRKTSRPNWTTMGWSSADLSQPRIKSLLVLADQNSSQSKCLSRWPFWLTSNWWSRSSTFGSNLSSHVEPPSTQKPSMPSNIPTRARASNARRPAMSTSSTLRDPSPSTSLQS